MLNLARKTQEKQKKVIIFGLGSAGYRHLQTLEDYFDKYNKRIPGTE